jgi:DNA-binding NarL/FixJ family response regulator
MSLDNTARPMDIPPNARPEIGREKLASGQPIRILLVDGNASFLEFAQEELSLQADFEVVASVRTGKGALDLSRELSPHVVFLDLFVVLLDLFVPGQNAMETILRLKALPHPPKVIIVSHRDSEEYRPAALAAGADEFLIKPQFKLLARPLVRKLVVRH